MIERTPISHRLLLRQIAICACLLLADCNIVTIFTPPVWPSGEAVQAFDIRPIESNSAIQLIEAMAVTEGIAHLCGDPPVPPDLRIPDAEIGPVEDAWVRASREAVLTEVERHHPGDSGNGRAANVIWWSVIEQGVARGAQATRTRGCDAVRPEYVAGYRAMLAWRSVEQSDQGSRWRER